MPDAELEQRRRTVAVLDLLTESFEARTRGDGTAKRAAVDQAMEIGGLAVTGVIGGMLIGEVPNPERDWGAWVEYVAANRDALAALEASDA